MIAIVDSGSTKADWVFLDGKKKKSIESPGMNPNLIDRKEVFRLVKKSVAPKIDAGAVEKIFYFGTGCSGKRQRAVISGALKKIFRNAEIRVDHDVMGAVIATCGDEKGIACIIGTGSNSVYFDGNKIHKNNYGLGFVLGDEGAGTYLGKKIITNYLYGLLPPKLSDAFKKKYNLSKEDALKNIYGNPTANTWIGSFASFYFEHKSDKWIRKTIREGFEEFVSLFVMNYAGYKRIPVHFIGSIAWHHREILKDVLKKKKIIPGKIIRKPIDDLAQFFSREK